LVAQLCMRQKTLMNGRSPNWARPNGLRPIRLRRLLSLVSTTLKHTSRLS